MLVSAVRLKIKVRLSNGSRACVDPVFFQWANDRSIERALSGVRQNEEAVLCILPRRGDYFARLCCDRVRIIFFDNRGPKPSCSSARLSPSTPEHATSSRCASLPGLG
jgi:hypothetical protein